MDRQERYQDYTRKCITMGRITLMAGLATSLIPAITLALVFGYRPTIGQYLAACGMFVPFLIAGWIVEPTAYFAALGVSGSYLGWMTGNLSSIRIPPSVMAQKVAGTEDGSPEAEYISTLAVGVSVVISTAFMLAAIIGGVQLISRLPARLNTALSYILPAVFGALLVNFSIKMPLLGAIGLGISIVLNLLHAPGWLATLVTVFGVVALAFLLDSIKKKNHAASAN